MSHHADPEKYKSTLNSLAYGEAMLAAARDYQAELLAEQEFAQAKAQHKQVLVHDLMEDPELEKLYSDRMAAMKQEAERRAEMRMRGHGTYAEVDEADVLEITTSTDLVVCHFYHPEFERCRVMDKHFAILCHNYFDTRFIKVNADLGGRDDFPTSALEALLKQQGVLKEKETDEDSVQDMLDQQRNSVVHGLIHRERDEDDESSDFDD